MNDTTTGLEQQVGSRNLDMSTPSAASLDHNKILGPRLLLHVEGATLFAMSVLLYALTGGNWWLFALLLLVPDISMLGYLAGTTTGAYIYNTVHAYPLPALLAAYGLLGANPLATWLALIWFAHIGMDRTVGYGLKYTSAFKDTHLGRV